MHITFYQYSNLIIHREKHTGLVGRGFFVHFYSFVCFFIIIIIIIIIICLYVFYICVFISVIVVDCTLVKICFWKKRFQLKLQLLVVFGSTRLKKGISCQKQKKRTSTWNPAYSRLRTKFHFNQATWNFATKFAQKVFL